MRKGLLPIKSLVYLQQSNNKIQENFSVHIRMFSQKKN
jgi:hypothetical protein